MDDSELGHYDTVQHHIDTGDSLPIKQQPYRTPVVQRDKIAEFIRNMRHINLIRLSHTPTQMRKLATYNLHNNSHSPSLRCLVYSFVVTNFLHLLQ